MIGKVFLIGEERSKDFVEDSLPLFASHLQVSLADFHFHNPHRRIGYACGCAHSELPNLAKISARILEIYYFASPFRKEDRRLRLLRSGGIFGLIVFGPRWPIPVLRVLTLDRHFFRRLVDRVVRQC